MRTSTAACVHTADQYLWCLSVSDLNELCLKHVVYRSTLVDSCSLRGDATHTITQDTRVMYGQLVLVLTCCFQIRYSSVHGRVRTHTYAVRRSLLRVVYATNEGGPVGAVLCPQLVRLTTSES